jgi:hypothetical protein
MKLLVNTGNLLARLNGNARDIQGMQQRVKQGYDGDFASHQCRKKAADKGYNKERIDFQLLDAESLPFGDNSFDVSVTGMARGLMPN